MNRCLLHPRDIALMHEALAATGQGNSGGLQIFSCFLQSFLPSEFEVFFDGFQPGRRYRTSTAQ